MQRLVDSLEMIELSELGFKKRPCLLQVLLSFRSLSQYSLKPKAPIFYFRAERGDFDFFGCLSAFASALAQATVGWLEFQPCSKLGKC